MIHSLITDPYTLYSRDYLVCPECKAEKKDVFESNPTKSLYDVKGVCRKCWHKDWIEKF